MYPIGWAFVLGLYAQRTCHRKRDRLTCEPFMSADDASGLASDPPPTDDHDKVEPTVRDALIGAAIGLLLIYAGTRISYWILRWLVIGVGLMFGQKPRRVRLDSGF